MKSLVKNRKAHFDFAINEEIFAGIVLSGNEVKSLKAGQASLNGAYVSIRHEQAYLVHAHITHYKYAGEAKGYDPERERKLLLNKKEIRSLAGGENGAIIVPLEIVQTDRGLIKVKIGVGRGKKKYDKRESIKKREAQRRIRRVED